MKVKIFLLLCMALLQGCTSASRSEFILRDGTFALLESHRATRNLMASGQKSSSQPGFLLEGHQIASGEGIIIAVREFAAKALQVDSGGFQKLTIWIPLNELSAGRAVPLNTEIVAFWSTGGANTPGAFGCFGYADAGEIQVLEISRQSARFRINLHFSHLEAVGPGQMCNPRSINSEIKAEIRKPEELDYWEGKKGGDLYDQSHHAG